MAGARIRTRARKERVFERVCANETAPRAVNAEASNVGRRQGGIAPGGSFVLIPLPAPMRERAALGKKADERRGVRPLEPRART